MQFASTYIDIIAASVALISCIVSVIMVRITWLNSREIEFYSRKEKLRDIRNNLLELSKATNCTEFMQDLERLKHDYIDELDDLCGRFSKKLLMKSDVKNDLILIKEHPDLFGDLNYSKELKKIIDDL